MSFVLALDEGTTSARAILFDRAGQIHAVAQQEFTQFFPQSGWVEHDAHEIWQAQRAVAEQVLKQAQLTARDIAAIGITNQRETTVLWDRATGEPIAHALVWQDRRTAPLCEQLIAAGHADLVQQRTGLLIDAYFSGTKIVWLLDNIPHARERAERGELAFGTIDTWLLWKLTGGRVHITDASNAARTMLLNIHTGAWDDELLKIMNIPRSVLPEVRSSSEVYAEVSDLPALTGVPIAGIAGDQQAALFGQLCLSPGMTKNTYGTGCFMLQNTGKEAVKSQNRLLTTIAWKLGDEIEYALEGSVFIGGAVVQWLRDGLGIIRSSSEVEPLASSVPDSGGVYVVPAFAGLGAPHWDPHARGALLGITRGTTAAHLARAALDSIAYQVADLLDAMHADVGVVLPELRVDGGAAANNLLLQFQADLLGVPVLRPVVTETTALGAAYLAGLAVSYWENTAALAQQWQIETRFEPQMPREQAAALRARWQEALGRSKGWHQSTDAAGSSTSS